MQTQPQNPTLPTPQHENSHFALATVIRDRFVAAGASGAVTAALGEALTRRFRTDAHFQAASSPLGRRLSSKHIGAVPISMGALCIDLDGPGHLAGDDWIAETDAAIRHVLEAHPGGFAYRTRGGWRLLWRLPEAFEISSAADAAEWKARYLIACDYIADRFGIECDRSCADWSRLFRLPHATRDVGGQPEELPTIGDASAIGVFVLPRAEDMCPRTPLALEPGAPAAQMPRVDVGHVSSRPGACLLYRLLAERGDILRPRGDRAFVIRCPNVGHHSTGRDGDGSTLLYLPEGTGYGVIHCKHSGCIDFEIQDWLEVLGAGGDGELCTACIESYSIDRDERYGLRLVLMLSGDGVPRYLRVYARHSRRWDALWAACDLETPAGDDLADVRAQARGLIGATIALEVSSGVVKRILEVAT